jgi:hypothetical protein
MIFLVLFCNLLVILIYYLLITKNGGREMSVLIIGIIIILSVIADYFIFDYDDKRWGWLKGRSKRVRIGIISCYLVMSFIIYFALSLKYIS